MQDQRGRIGRSSINKQYHHLTIALACSVMRAGTILGIQPSGVKVEGLYHPQACLRQFLLEPGKHLIVRAIGREDRGGRIHSGPLMNDYSFILQVLLLELKSNLTHVPISRIAYPK
jgi:hypothetical protein